MYRITGKGDFGFIYFFFLDFGFNIRKNYLTELLENGMKPALGHGGFLAIEGVEIKPEWIASLSRLNKGLKHLE